MTICIKPWCLQPDLFVVEEPVRMTGYRWAMKEKGRLRQRQREKREGGMRREQRSGEKARGGRNTAILQACRWAGSPGVGGWLCKQHTDTQQGLMEGLWISTNFQLSLSTWQPPTRHGFKTSRPPASQMSSEEGSDERQHGWWRCTARGVSHSICAVLVTSLEMFPQVRRKHNTQTQTLTDICLENKRRSQRRPTWGLRVADFLLELCLYCSWGKNQHSVGVKAAK